MAELLVKARDASHPDSDTDVAGCYKMGDIVVAMPDGHSWRSGETLPSFVVVKCPQLDIDTARQRIQSWNYEYDVTILQRNVALDGWRFRIDNLNRRTSDHAGSPKLAKVSQFLSKWGASFVRMDPEGPVIDWSINSGATSESFLGTDASSVGATINETNYDQGTGDHTYRLVWDAELASTPEILEFRFTLAQNRITELGGTVTLVEAMALEYVLPRQSVMDAFKADLQARVETYKRRRYSFPRANVQAMIDAGQIEITLTLTQIQNLIIDHRSL